MDYKEKVRLAKEALESGSYDKETIEYIFPELKESEDEKIRKELITHCRNTRCVTEEGAERIVKWISWLEKQGKLMKCLQIANSKIGDLIEENYYLRENLDKQGEQNPVIKMKTPEESLGIDSDTYNKIVDECIYGEQKHIKEHNACEFCADRYGCVNPCSMKLIEAKNPADKVEPRQEELTEFEKAVKQVMEEAIECGDTHNLKADADMLLRLVQKPWSEEDREMSRFIGNAITVNDASIYLESKGIQVIDAHVWLEELKERVQPQSHWRPSYEQVSVLEFVMNDIEKDSIRYRILNSVLEQLKKLMKE